MVIVLVVVMVQTASTLEGIYAVICAQVSQEGAMMAWGMLSCASCSVSLIDQWCGSRIALRGFSRD